MAWVLRKGSFVSAPALVEALLGMASVDLLFGCHFLGLRKDEITNESGMMHLHLNQIPNPVGMGRKPSLKGSLLESPCSRLNKIGL